MTEIIKKIEDVENRIFNQKNTLDKNYYDHCILSFYLYKYLKKNSNLDLANKYFLRSRISLKNYFDNVKYIPLTYTWYGGVGLLYILRNLNQDGDLDDKIICLENRINNVVNNLNKDYRVGLYNSDLDILNGLSGVGIYFLDNNPIEYQWLLRKINNKLFQILSIFYKKNTNNQYVIINGKEIDYCISHGILGILYYLSKYYRVFNDKEILEQINTYLIDYKIFLKNENHSYLNKFPMYGKKVNNETGYRYPERVSWCYGVIGIYRALYLIFKNINDINMKNEIVKQMKLFETSEIDDYNLQCPTFCHGYSGIYYILSQFRNDEKELNYERLINELESKIWSFYNDEFMYCFPKYDYDKNGEKHNKEDKTSIVDGIASICISYLSAHIDMNNDFFARSLALK